MQFQYYKKVVSKDKFAITTYEHQSLRIDKGEVLLPKDAFETLQKFYGDNGVPYYSLIHNGVKFNEYVGVLQVGKYIIEVLPKTENSDNNESDWRGVLINMLKAVGIFDIHATSSSSLSIKSNSILDLYFNLFVNETEQLLHQGLIKRYHKVEGNRTALKGNIVFSKHIQQNLVHKERFCVRYTTYDSVHPLNAVLYKTLLLLNRINTNPTISSRIGSLLLNFPEMPPVKTDESFFEKLVFNRKNEPYKNAIQIAKLLLLNYHPDISKGKNDVLALMFDMNLLWEQFVFVSLRKHLKVHLPDATINSQTKFDFWKPQSGYTMRLKPDIVVRKGNGIYLVFDTKWKNLKGNKPSPDDLRQMYTYSKYHKNATTALLYPGIDKMSKSLFINEDSIKNEGILCKIFEIPVINNIIDWQIDICRRILTQPISRIL
jgi:5-methylcytosine-specific restriction enzyme subunit McrC